MVQLEFRRAVGTTGRARPLGNRLSGAVAWDMDCGGSRADNVLLQADGAGTACSPRWGFGDGRDGVAVGSSGLVSAAWLVGGYKAGDGEDGDGDEGDGLHGEGDLMGFIGVECLKEVDVYG